MAKTITLKSNLHLSKNFAGVDHGEKVGDYKKGKTMEVKSNELADVLIERGLATELQVDGSTAKPDKK